MGLIDQGLKQMTNLIIKEVLTRIENGQLSNDINSLTKRAKNFLKKDLIVVIKNYFTSNTELNDTERDR